MLKCKIGITLFLVLITGSIRAQNVISGRILDNESHKAIGYVNLITHSQSIISNDSGFFSFTIKELNDSIKIHSLGYSDRMICIKDYIRLKKDTILLNPVSFKINEITINYQRKKTKTIKLGNIGKNHRGCYSFSVGSKIALYIPNEIDKNLKVVSFNVFIKKMKKEDGPLRLHIYKHNIYGPIDELLNENIIISGNYFEEWVTVDLSRFSVFIPHDGLYIGLELLPAQREIFISNIDTLNRKCTIGKTLIAMNNEQDWAHRTWQIGFSNNDKWFQFEDKPDVFEGAPMLYINVNKQ